MNDETHFINSCGSFCFSADTKKVWSLLQFMENLEKALYNAYEGTASQMTTHGKVKSQNMFFRQV